MVMNEDDICGIIANCTFDYLAGRHSGRGNSAVLDYFKIYVMHLCVQADKGENLVFSDADFRYGEHADVGAVGKGNLSVYTALKIIIGKSGHHIKKCGSIIRHIFFKVLAVCFKHAVKAAETVNKNMGESVCVFPRNGKIQKHFKNLVRFKAVDTFIIESFAHSLTVSVVMTFTLFFMFFQHENPSEVNKYLIKLYLKSLDSSMICLKKYRKKYILNVVNGDMQNYLMILSYDGTRYSGWQKQGNTGNSIQEKVESVLSRMCGKKVEVNASGRTDAGVHALAQSVSFKCGTDKEPSEIKGYLNEYLPKDIAVQSVEKAEERFHARLCAKRKTYLYRINNSGVSNVFERKYVYDVKEKLNVRDMEEAAQCLLGEHDFKAFCSLKKTKKSTVRTIYDITVSEGNGEIKIFITGSGFLYNMVRIITGTLIEVGKGERSAEDVKQALLSLKRKNAGYTAPPEGLTLIKAEY